MIRRFFRRLWQLAGFLWPFSGSGQYFRGAGTLWTFLFLLFVIFYAIAWIFGFSPPVVTAWLDAHADLWRGIADWLWRIFWGVVLFVCGLVVFGVLMEFFGKRAEDAKDVPRDIKGGSCMLVAVVVVSYIAWIAITMTD